LTIGRLVSIGQSQPSAATTMRRNAKCK
jgi:hypothetical protein